MTNVMYNDEGLNKCNIKIILNGSSCVWWQEKIKMLQT